jgi:hypothetical protein
MSKAIRTDRNIPAIEGRQAVLNALGNKMMARAAHCRRYARARSNSAVPTLCGGCSRYSQPWPRRSIPA